MRRLFFRKREMHLPSRLWHLVLRNSNHYAGSYANWLGDQGQYFPESRESSSNLGLRCSNNFHKSTRDHWYFAGRIWHRRRWIFSCLWRLQKINLAQCEKRSTARQSMLESRWYLGLSVGPRQDGDYFFHKRSPLETLYSSIQNGEVSVDRTTDHRIVILIDLCAWFSLSDRDFSPQLVSCRSNSAFLTLATCRSSFHLTESTKDSTSMRTSRRKTRWSYPGTSTWISWGSWASEKILALCALTRKPPSGYSHAITGHFSPFSLNFNETIVHTS